MKALYTGICVLVVVFFGCDDGRPIAEVQSKVVGTDAFAAETAIATKDEDVSRASPDVTQAVVDVLETATQEQDATDGEAQQFELGVEIDVVDEVEVFETASAADVVEVVDTAIVQPEVAEDEAEVTDISISATETIADASFEEFDVADVAAEVTEVAQAIEIATEIEYPDAPPEALDDALQATETVLASDATSIVAADVTTTVDAGLDVEIFEVAPIDLCVGKNCDDGNTCTADSCDSSKGCANLPLDGTPCSDGNQCTFEDSCKKGVCTAGTTTFFQENFDTWNKGVGVSNPGDDVWAKGWAHTGNWDLACNTFPYGQKVITGCHLWFGQKNEKNKEVTALYPLNTSIEVARTLIFDVQRIGNDPELTLKSGVRFLALDGKIIKNVELTGNFGGNNPYDILYHAVIEIPVEAKSFQIWLETSLTWDGFKGQEWWGYSERFDNFVAKVNDATAPACFK